jgi:hypothetical protein
MKIGAFGSCRIQHFYIKNFVKNRNELPYFYSNNEMQINIMPLGYTTTSSDIYQNLKLIKTNEYKNIKNNFIYKNIFFTRGGVSIIKDIDYDYLILEICSMKKIIHKKSNLIIPYIIEGKYNIDDYKLEIETEDEIIKNIVNIQKLINCKIILLPPLTVIKENIAYTNAKCKNYKWASDLLDVRIEEQTGKQIKGKNIIYNNPSKVLLYRNKICSILKKAENNKNIFYYDWNKHIIEKGEKYMLKDLYHWTKNGYIYNSNKIINYINDLSNNQLV